MGVTNHFLSGMILQVIPKQPGALFSLLVADFLQDSALIGAMHPTVFPGMTSMKMLGWFSAESFATYIY